MRQYFASLWEIDTHILSASTSLKYIKQLVDISTNTRRRMNDFQTTLQHQGLFFSKARQALSPASYIVRPIFMAGTHLYSSIKALSVLRYVSDGLSNISESHPEFNLPEGLLSARNHPNLEISDSPAHEAVLGLLREHAPRSITYIALGPLTNLAQTLRRDGACVRERIGRVVIMGGALDVPGNTSPSAECAHHPSSISRWSC